MSVIVLIAPQNPFYADRLRGLADGFIARGYPCIVHDGIVDHDLLAEWLVKIDAALCIEINRSPSRSVNWPSHIPHAAWICDYRVDGERITERIGVSQHLYFLIHPSAFGMVPPEGSSWSMLLPGVPADSPVPPKFSYLRDFCMTGFIPEPLGDGSPVSRMADGRVVTLGEFTKVFPTELWSQSRISLKEIRKAVEDTCAHIGCQPIIDEDVLHLLDELIPRTLDRRRILEAVLNVSDSLDIYGPKTWLKWPQFAPFYRGFIANPADLDPIYRTTRINLHNSGLSMHFRVLDCMAAGGFIIVNETPLDDLPGGICNYFEAGREYGSYAISDIEDVAKHYLHADYERLRMINNARLAVMANHTYTHRAGRILNDFGLPQHRHGDDVEQLMAAAYHSKESWFGDGAKARLRRFLRGGFGALDRLL